MDSNKLIRFAGWSAYVNVIANIIGFVSLFVFFAVGGPAGIINDSSSVFFSLSLIPLALAWYQLHRSLFPSLSLAVTIIGILGMLIAAILQALLVFGLVEFEQTLQTVLIANAIIGVWLIGNGLLAQRSAILPQGLAWIAILAGIGLVLIIVGFWIGGETQPLTAIGGLVAFLGILSWAIWFGRLLLANPVRSFDKSHPMEKDV